MKNEKYSIIIGTGSYTPEIIADDNYFHNSKFHDESSQLINKPSNEIVTKLKEISGIEERRITPKHLNNSDLAYEAAKIAIKDANIDAETLDYIIFGHNFGNSSPDNARVDILPNLSSRLKNKLKILKPECMCFDILTGCPSFIQAMIMADTIIKSNKAKKILVVGGDTASRIADPHDRDVMLFGDGACAFILEVTKSEKPVGILTCSERADTNDREANFFKIDKSFSDKNKYFYLKMQGKRLYNYAVKTVPQLVAKNIKDAGIDVSDVKKIFIHQANHKMDLAILKGLLKQFNINEVDESVMPMIIKKLGNTAAASVGIVYDMVIKEKLKEHKVNSGDYICFCSVGAGMFINSIIYKMP